MRRTWRRSRLGTAVRHGTRANRRRLRLALWAGLLLAGLGLAWIAITAFLAWRQVVNLDHRLQAVRQLVAQGDVAGAARVAKEIPAVAGRAHELTSGPAWWTAAHLPWLGEPAAVARGITTAGARVAGVVPQLMSVAQRIDPTALRTSGDTVDLAPLARAAPALRAASRSVSDAAAAIDLLPGSTWLGAVDSGREHFARDLSVVQGYLVPAARVAGALPTMLGADGPQTYFIGLQNEAELRGTGGLPGAFAIARTDHGTITFLRFESDAALLPPNKGHLIPTGLSFGAGYAAAYGSSQPTESFVDSNVSPHFPYAARIWQAMWQKVSGQRVDGVIALDPTVLAGFLAVTGPATLPDGTVIDSANVVDLTQRDQYTRFSDNLARKNFVVSILRAASRKLTSGTGSAQGILQAISAAGNDQRLLAWSADPTVERVLLETKFAGSLPTGSRPFSAAIVNNAAAGKLDYYLVRSETYERTGCGPTRDVLVTVKLQNNAPASGLPPYVVSRLDTPPPGAKPGDNHVLLDYYATAGAQLLSVAVDGHATTANVFDDRGRPIFRLSLELPRGTTQTVVLHLAEPAGTGAPQIWRQPGVTSLAVQYYNQRC